MFSYYLRLALRSIRRQPVLTALMVLAVGMGIGSSVTTLTLFRALSADPIPGKSAKLFYPQIDPQDLQGYRPGEDPPAQMARFDAQELIKLGKGRKQAMMTRGSVIVESGGQLPAPELLRSRYTSPDFFELFEVPFLFGTSWSKEDEERRARVVVISSELNDQIFSGKNSVGETLTIAGENFKVLGVLEPWSVKPFFYDLSAGNYADAESVYFPFLTSRELKLAVAGNLQCWGDPPKDDPEEHYGLNAPCSWLQYWVELEAQEVESYKAHLEQYSANQRELGRFERPTNVRLYSLNAWLEKNEVVPKDVHIQLWISLGFLLVCLVNTVGLLLTKFLRRAGSLAVRRALGASRTQLFAQLLVESGLIGVLGGVLGVALALLGLWTVRQQPDAYAKLAMMDATMLFVTFAVSLLSMLIAGCLPAWRVSSLAPAGQLKSQ